MEPREALEIIRQFSGQASIITIPRFYLDRTRDIKVALFISQLVYWSGKSHLEDGWFYKSYQDWEDDILLSKNELPRAMQYCKDHGFLETKVAKVDGLATLHLRLLESGFQNWLSLKSGNQDSLKSGDGFPENQESLNKEHLLHTSLTSSLTPQPPKPTPSQDGNACSATEAASIWNRTHKLGRLNKRERALMDSRWSSTTTTEEAEASMLGYSQSEWAKENGYPLAGYLKDPLSWLPNEHTALREDLTVRTYDVSRYKPVEPLREIPPYNNHHRWNRYVPSAEYHWNGHAPVDDLEACLKDPDFDKNFDEIARRCEELIRSDPEFYSWLTLPWVLQKKGRRRNWERIFNGEFKPKQEQKGKNAKTASALMAQLEMEAANGKNN